MSTPHNNAKKGDIAKTILMPGDPLRAKFVAEKYLENPVVFNNVRGMLGYTGTYKGKALSVMGSGMGIPSIGIYSYELYTTYDVDNIIRIGSAGGYSEKLELHDVVLATEAYSESTYARYQNGFEGDVIAASPGLVEKLRDSAKHLGVSISEGRIHSTDVFYRTIKAEPEYWKKLREEKNCIAVDMEAFGLFHNAGITGKNAACILTISDLLYNLSREMPVEQREKSLTAMIETTLGAI
jgi:purine-nucleoside phosphorylase